VLRPDQSRFDFAYEANGNLTLLVNLAGIEHRFGYNRVNHRSGYTKPLSGSYVYPYDRDRRPTETLLPSGRLVRNVYDHGRLIATATPERRIDFSYLCGSKVGSCGSGSLFKIELGLFLARKPIAAPSRCAPLLTCCAIWRIF
jgi:hypothetical protein